ncbi:hypothetical protein ACRAWD_03725 [Caulobacter segnis]
MRYQVFLRTIAKPGAVPSDARGGDGVGHPLRLDGRVLPAARSLASIRSPACWAARRAATKPLMAVENGQADLPAGTTCEVFARHGDGGRRPGDRYPGPHQGPDVRRGLSAGRQAAADPRQGGVVTER